MVCAATSRPYRARTATFARHVVTVVELGGKWVQLDASLGRCFFLPGTTELASLDELIARPELAEAESPAIAAMLRESQGTDLPYYGHVDDGVWPPGAPAE